MLALAALVGGAALSRDEHEAIIATRDAMCRGVIREMHTEIHKHSLRKNGEDDIYETVPAICLAIVQNYTLTKTASSSWELLKRATKLDDDEGGMPDPESFKHIMTLKKACETFTDDFQQELSELMYKDALAKDPETIIDEFCLPLASLKKPKRPAPPKKRAPASPSPPKSRKGSEPPAAAGPPSMDDLLKKYDTDGSISNLIELERENPEAMLEPDDLAKVLRDEDGLSEIVGDICVGVPESSGEYPKYPGNPPLWGEMYRVREREGRWRMLRLPKGAPIEEKGGNSEYTYMVIKHAMISRACRDVVADLEPDLAEVIYSHAPEVGWSAKELGATYCAATCSGDAKDEL